MIRASSANPIYDLFPPKSAAYITASKVKPDTLTVLNHHQPRSTSQSRAGDSRLEARIASYELAAKLQISAPEVMDISKESDATERLYGIDDPSHGRFRTQLSGRAAHAGARGPVRAGLERRG